MQSKTKNEAVQSGGEKKLSKIPWIRWRKMNHLFFIQEVDLAPGFEISSCLKRLEIHSVLCAEPVLFVPRGNWFIDWLIDLLIYWLIARAVLCDPAAVFCPTLGLQSCHTSRLYWGRATKRFLCQTLPFLEVLGCTWAQFGPKPTWAGPAQALLWAGADWAILTVIYVIK